MINKVYITYGYEGGESFTRIHFDEWSAKQFIKDFYRWKISEQPTNSNFVRLMVADVESEHNAVNALEWARS